MTKNNRLYFEKNLRTESVTLAAYLLHNRVNFIIN